MLRPMTKIKSLPFFQEISKPCLYRTPESIQYCTLESSPKEISKKNHSHKTTKTKVKDVSQDIVQYLSTLNPGFIVDSIPKKYLVKTKNAKVLYLANPKVGEHVANVLRPHIEMHKAKVIECNPGLGLLTSFLLEMKINDLFLHEADPFFHNKLFPLLSSPKVQLFSSDILQVPRCSTASKKYNLILEYINKTDWEDNCNYQMIAAVNNQDFARYLIKNFTHQDGLLTYGRPLMYLFITPTTYEKLTAGPPQTWNLYKPLAVLFQIVFNIEFLMKIERQAFVPWTNGTTISEKTSPDELTKENSIYLIKIEGKQDVYKKLGKHNAHRLKTLQKFVTHAIGRKKQRVIPTIEQWVPGFGPHLIARNINVYTTFNELTPDEILELFCMIHHIPGYEEFDIPEEELEEKAKEEIIDTSIDMFMEDEEHDDEGIPDTR